MTDTATNSDKPAPAQAAPPPQAAEQSVESLAASRGITAKDIDAVAGQGLRPSSVNTVAVRVEGALLAGAQKIDQGIARADQIVNGSQPIGQGLVTAANEQLKTQPGHNSVIDHGNGIGGSGLYVPGVADRVAAHAQRAIPTGLAHGAGAQNAMNAVNQMQASGDICHQTSGKISGASYVVNTCVGGLTAGGGGNKQVSVQAGIRF